jgi:hypothetical protein
MYAKWIDEDGRFAFSEENNGGVEIRADEHAQLFAPQRTYKVIGRNAEGYPELQVPPPPSREELEGPARIWRDARLAMTDQMISRHRDERDLAITSTLTEPQFLELLSYRQELRDWPESLNFPAVESRPSTPAWLEAL